MIAVIIIDLDDFTKKYTKTANFMLLFPCGCVL